MRDVVGQMGVSEVILLFILIFLLPLMYFLVTRLRRYEALYGALSARGGRPAKRGEEENGPEAEAAATVGEEDGAKADAYPYQARQFLTAADMSCLAALREALGEEVEVFPRVGLGELVEPTDKARGYAERLVGKRYDFLICDRKTGKPLTAVMYKPGRGGAAGAADETGRIGHAAGVSMVSIDMAEEYDASGMRDALGIPDLDV